MDKNGSFVQALAFGRIEEEVVLPYPKFMADPEVLHQVLASVRQLLGSKAKEFAEWDVRAEMPREFLEEMKAFGLFGLIVPEEFGGMGFGAFAYSRTVQEIARYDASVAITLGAHSSIGMRGLLLFGTNEQKKRWLPQLATGEMIAAFALTEPGAGSDAAAIRTNAVQNGRGEWVLNGEKLWISNGGIADFFTVLAKTPQIMKDGKPTITAFVVTRDMPGVSSGPHENKMGIRASNTTTVRFDDVIVPKDHVLGEVGSGFKVAMAILNSGRTGLGGGCVGASKELIRLATLQAKERKQFGHPLCDFGLIKEKMGAMVVDTYATESVVGLVAGLVDQGWKNYQVEAAISKIFATEALWRVCDEALQIAGGNGFMREFPYERFMRDARINRIFEGTNDILRLFVALTSVGGVGAQLKDVVSTLKHPFSDPMSGLEVLSDYVLRQASIRTGFVGEKRHWKKLHPALRPVAERYEENTRALAWKVDMALRRHGKKIVDEQIKLRRFADVMIDLFAEAAMLSRVNMALESSGEEKAKPEMDMLRVFDHSAGGRIRGNLRGLGTNADGLVKKIADGAFEREGYGWDLT